MFYFYLIDQRQNLHHGYWIHTPFWWLLIATITFAAIWLLKEVPAVHDFWVWNFVLHWTFLFEVGVVIQADSDARNEIVIQVMDAAKAAGVNNIMIAAGED